LAINVHDETICINGINSVYIVKRLNTVQNINHTFVLQGQVAYIHVALECCSSYENLLLTKHTTSDWNTSMHTFKIYK